VAARRIRRDGRDLALTVREFGLLAFFLSHPGRAFTRAELLGQVWGQARPVPVARGGGQAVGSVGSGGAVWQMT
jgi:DNA-binding response OmpR family regulator